MPGIFISYRKEDTRAWAIHLRDHLEREFGHRQIFFDVDSIDVGQWRAQIDRALDQCRVMVVLIGPRWATATDATGRNRLALPDDVHRVEIATALCRRDVTVIPLLVEGARLPLASDLPDDIRGLLERQAREIGDAHERRVVELRQLSRTIGELTGRRRLRVRAAFALAAIIGAGLVNAFIATQSTGSALTFLTIAAVLAVLAWQTYRPMARDHMKGAWVALLAVIFSFAMVAGSVIRLVPWGTNQ
jgi:hypothetical protein